jgi:hypothetical protein
MSPPDPVRTLEENTVRELQTVVSLSPHERTRLIKGGICPHNIPYHSVRNARENVGLSRIALLKSSIAPSQFHLYAMAMARSL